jgi:hypothetical protein
VYNKGPSLGWTRRQAGGTFEWLYVRNIDGNPNVTANGSTNIDIGWSRTTCPGTINVGRPLVMRAWGEFQPKSPDFNATIYARSGVVPPEAIEAVADTEVPRILSGGTFMYDSSSTPPAGRNGCVVTLPQWIADPLLTKVSIFTGGGFKVRVLYTQPGGSGAAPGPVYWIFPKGMTILYFQQAGSAGAEPVETDANAIVAAADEFVVWVGVDLNNANALDVGGFFDVTYLSANRGQVVLMSSGTSAATGAFLLNTDASLPAWLPGYLLTHPNLT